MSSDPNKPGQYPPPQWDSQPQRGAYPIPPHYRVSSATSIISHSHHHHHHHHLSLSFSSPSFPVPLLTQTCKGPTSTRLRKFSINTWRDGDSTSTSTRSPRYAIRDATSRYVFSLWASGSSDYGATSYGLSESTGTETEDGHRVSIL